jgi:spore photoproduct lyase
MPIIRERHRLVRSYGGGIVRYFYKTPSDIVCPHFWELNWAYGCYFDCAYCYLQGTFRGKKKPWYRPVDDVIDTLNEVFRERNEPTLFNSGELADSLMNPSRIKKIMDKFEEQNKHKLLLLTKSTNVKFLLETPRKQTIVSFSINAIKPAKFWERGVPSPRRRIIAAKMVSEAGYETRIRIDPMVPVPSWEEEYRGLIDEIFKNFSPSRITLGTLRGLRKTIMFCKDNSWVKYLSEKKTGWGKKIEFDKRCAMYSMVLEYLEKKYGYANVALCKETLETWKELELVPGTYPRWEKCKCNCVW